MSIELADKLYTSTQVADILGVSLRTLYRYMEDGKIQSMRTASGRHRFTKDQILDFLNADQVAGYSSHDEEGVQGGQFTAQTQVSTATGFRQQGRVDSTQTPRFDPMTGKPIQQSQQGGYSDDGTSPTSSDFAVPKTTVDGGKVYGQDTTHLTFSATNRPRERESFTGVGSVTAGAQENLRDSGDVSTSATSRDDGNQPIAPYEHKGETQQKESFTDLRSRVSGEEIHGMSSARMSPQGVQQTVVSPLSQVEQKGPEKEQPLKEEAPVDRGVRFYKSDYVDLIELAKKIKEVANLKELEYAFTLYSGLSLHFPIKPFTLLHIYANPEDMQIWRNELRLTSVSTEEEANLAILVNTDIVFVPTKEIGGFKVVDDKILLRDLASHKDEDLLAQFRQHISDN